MSIYNVLNVKILTLCVLVSQVIAIGIGMR
jgi:hypothetical protein